MKLTMLSILMAVCSSMLAQEPAARRPRRTGAGGAGQGGERPRKIPARIAAGTIIALDAESTPFPSPVRTTAEG